MPQYRHIFLTAAQELRAGEVTEGRATTASQDTIVAMPIDLLMDLVGIHIIRGQGRDINIGVN